MTGLDLLFKETKFACKFFLKIIDFLHFYTKISLKKEIISFSFMCELFIVKLIVKYFLSDAHFRFLNILYGLECRDFQCCTLNKLCLTALL